MSLTSADYTIVSTALVARHLWTPLPTRRFEVRLTRPDWTTTGSLAVGTMGRRPDLRRSGNVAPAVLERFGPVAEAWLRDLDALAVELARSFGPDGMTPGTIALTNDRGYGPSSLIDLDSLRGELLGWGARWGRGRPLPLLGTPAAEAARISAFADGLLRRFARDFPLGGPFLP